MLSLQARPAPRRSIPTPAIAALAAAWDEALTSARRGRRLTRQRADAPAARLRSRATSGCALDRRLGGGGRAAGRPRRTRARSTTLAWLPATRARARRPRRCATPGAGARATRATSTPRTGGSARASTPRRRRRRGGRAAPRRASPRVAEVFLNGEPRARAATRCSPPTRSTSATLLRRRQRAGDPLPGAGAAAARAAQARARAGAPGSSPTATCASSAPTLLGRAPGFAPGPAPRRALAPGRARAPPARRRRRAARCARASTATTACSRCARALRGARRRARRPASTSSSTARPATHRGELAVATADGAAVAAAASCACPASPAGGRTPTASRSLHDVRLRHGRRRRSRSTPAGSASATLAAGAGPATTSSATASTCTSTACRVFARGARLDAGRPGRPGAAPAELRAALERVRDAGHEHGARPGHRRLRERRLPRPLRRARPARLAGLHVRQPRLPVRGRRPSGRRSRREARRGPRRRSAGRPSLAVLCGNSEVEQQVAMLGLDPALGRGALFGETLPRARRGRRARRRLRALRAVRRRPAVPPRPRRRQLLRRRRLPAPARRTPARAGVRFAAECLAFANVPDEAGVEACCPARPPTSSSTTRAGRRACRATSAPAGTSTTSATTTSRALFGVDPVALRRVDPERYLELSRAVTRRGRWPRSSASGGGPARRAAAASCCGCATSSRAPAGACSTTAAAPKVAYHHLRRALAPVAVWMTDEGLGGVDVHVANDRPEPLRGAPARRALPRLRAARRRGAPRTSSSRRTAAAERDVEALLGRFVDAAWAYRFGPPAQDVDRREPGAATAAAAGAALPGGPLPRRAPGGQPSPPTGSGSQATARPRDDGDRAPRRSPAAAWPTASASTRPGFAADDDAFCVEPGARAQRRCCAPAPRARRGRARPSPRSTSTAACGSRVAEGVPA